MKRILSLLSLATLTGLTALTVAGCAEEEKPTTPPTVEPTPTPTPTPTVEKIAKDLVDSIILEQDGRAVEGDFSVLSELKRGSTTYPITWKSNNAKVTVGKKDDSTKSYAIAVNRNVEEETVVKLTATIEVSADDKASRDFEIVLQPYELYDFIEKFKFDLEGGNLWETYELPTEFTLPNAPQPAKIEWTCTGENSDLITIKKDEATGKVTLTAAVKFDKFPAQLTAKFTYKTETAEVKYDVNVFQQTIYTMENSIAKDTEYLFAMLQKNLENKYLWFDGTEKDDRLQTTTDVAKAKKIFAEEVEGGFHLYFKNGEAKKYINVDEKRKVSLGDAASETCKYVWDNEHNTVLIMTGKETYFFGTHGTYDTISASDMKYIDKGNFIANFYKPATIEAEEPHFEDQLLVDYEAEKFEIKPLNPGKFNLQLKGKKFDKVTIKYTLQDGKDVVTLAKDGKSLDVKVVTADTIIKLTVDFSLGDASASKDVEVKVPALDTLSVKDFVGAAKGTVAFTSGKVVAIEKDGFILQDASGLVYVRTAYSGHNNPKLGETVKFAGSKDVYFDFVQIKPVTDFDVIDNLKVETGEPVAYDKAKLEAAMAADPIVEYIELTGKMTIADDGKHINVNLDGCEKHFSIKGDKEMIDELKLSAGYNVTIKGYTAGTNTGKGYLTVMMTEFTSKAPADVLNTAKVAATKEAISKELPIISVAETTEIKLPNRYNANLTVTASNTLSWNAETGILTITPVKEVNEDKITIVITMGEATATLEANIKSQKIVSDTFAFSTEYNATATVITGGYKFVSGDATIEQVKGTSKNDVVNTYAEMRVYGGHKVTITSTKNIKKLVIITNTTKKFSTVTINGTEVTADDTTITWTGDTKEIVLENTGGSQGRVTDLVVFYE